LSPDGITIADIAEDGAVTDVRQLKLDLDPKTTPTTDPKWSPDGSQLAFVVRTPSPNFDGTHGYWIQVAIADADGSGLRLVADRTSLPDDADFAWSPDGRSLIVDPGYVLDVATGEQTKVGTPVESWQRLAP
jgi:Tol biopolymer transport system component